MEVKGRDSVTGLPRRTTVTSIEVREALAHPVRLICEAIRGILEEAPPEISADLVDSGITLVGGGSLLYGVGDALSDAFGVPAHLVTWGSILSEARANTFAWWLAVFPGFAIFATVTAYNLLGDGLRDALDPKS